MRISIAAPTLDTIYESNPQTYEEEKSNNNTHIGFKQVVTILNRDYKILTRDLSDEDCYTKTTVESVKISPIQSNANIEMISPLISCSQTITKGGDNSNSKENNTGGRTSTSPIRTHDIETN